MAINPPGNTLTAIQTKVRRLIRSPSTAQLSDDDLNNYINTFVVYDFPEQLRTFNLRATFNFWCNPFQDEYPTDIASYGGASNAAANPLYNFQNNYLTIHDPVYIAGYQSFYSQSREQFYGIYPNICNITQVGIGNSSTLTYSGVINSAQSIIPANLTQQVVLLRNKVLFSSVDVNLNGLAMIDVPILDSVTGNPTAYGNLYPQNNLPTNPLLSIAPYNLTPGGIPNSNNYINYVTGAFTVTFPVAPLSGELINSQTVAQIIQKPLALLFYDDRIILRPVPDQPYQINFEAYIRPVALLQTNSVPALEEWWQLISYGAARKVLQDRMDIETVNLIEPEFREQLRLCLRRTIVQYTNERTATIYTEQTTTNGNGWGFGPGLF